MWLFQGDVVLQSDHAIETLTKMAMSADKVDNVNINQGRWVKEEETEQKLWLGAGARALPFTAGFVL